MKKAILSLLIVVMAVCASCTKKDTVFPIGTKWECVVPISAGQDKLVLQLDFLNGSEVNTKASTTPATGGPTQDVEMKATYTYADPTVTISVTSGGATKTEIGTFNAEKTKLTIAESSGLVFVRK